MADLMGFNIPVSMPAIGGLSSNWLIYALAIIIFAIAGAVIIYLYIDWRTFNRKIIIFENVGEGHYQISGRDRARLIKIGNGGEEVLYLKKRKVYRSAYGRKMGKNTYWFAIGQDGYWYNIVLGDLDTKMGLLDIEPIDRDMRYMHVALRKNAEERYTNKPKFMEKYGTLIIVGIFLMIMIIAVWLLLDKIGEMMSASQSILIETSKSCEPAHQALARIDTICSGGSGLVPAK